MKMQGGRRSTLPNTQDPSGGGGEVGLVPFFYSLNSYLSALGNYYSIAGGVGGARVGPTSTTSSITPSSKSSSNKGGRAYSNTTWSVKASSSGGSHGENLCMSPHVGSFGLFGCRWPEFDLPNHRLHGLLSGMTNQCPEVRALGWLVGLLRGDALAFRVVGPSH
ncbi:hypothetical protein NE237_012318 [Protea cynaroides]|uniref:Uncharacterized protein n=1 Tax=Protea cynaroides TaxID=273540 RepID=A0A9Q0JYQ2_9MAGN|nr:hypothetical protein NE237_012318 [Protea cynaroides]